MSKGKGCECEFDTLTRFIAWMVTLGLLLFSVAYYSVTPTYATYSLVVAFVCMLFESAYLCRPTTGEEKGIARVFASNLLRAILYFSFSIGGLYVYAYIQSNYFLMVLHTVLLIDSGLYLILACQNDVRAEARASTASFGQGVGVTMY